MIEDTKNILLSYNVIVDQKMLNNIKNEFINRTKKKQKTSNHVSFVVDYKSREVLCYSFNLFYKSDKFPFSIHSEINTITKYYKTTQRSDRSKIKSKKILIILKLSKSGKLGNSKPCQACANYINNNLDNLNLIHIYYSAQNNTLVKLDACDMQTDIFRYSSGGQFYLKKKVDQKFLQKSSHRGAEPGSL